MAKKNKSDQEIDEWKEYRKSILKNKSKSDDDFEKYITFISSGALGLTLLFLDKIVPINESICIWIIASGWILLAITLLINLYSHYLSSRYSDDSINDLDENIEYDILVENINRRNNFVNMLNIWSIRSLVLGILSVLFYVIINVSNMSDKSKNPVRPVQSPKPLTEEKGRTIPKPPIAKPLVNPKK